LTPWNSKRLACAVLTDGARRRRLALTKKNNDGNQVRLLNHAPFSFMEWSEESRQVSTSRVSPTAA
jgi:hypothetical protein